MFDQSCLSHFIFFFLRTPSVISHTLGWVEGTRWLFAHGSLLPCSCFPCVPQGLGRKMSFKHMDSGGFLHGPLPCCPQPWLLLQADGSNYRRVIAVLDSGVPARDHSRQGCSLEKHQPWASSARVNSWTYFFFPLCPPRHSPGSADPQFHTPMEEQSLLSHACKPRKEIRGQKSNLFCCLFSPLCSHHNYTILTLLNHSLIQQA